MVRESRTIAELLLSEPDETTWQQQIINENILQTSSISTANRYARTLRLRLMTLDRECWKLIADGSESERLQMLLVALMVQSPIVAGFVADVVNPARQQFKEKALAEAGYLDSPRRRNLQNVFLQPDVATALHRLNKAELLPILEGNV